MRYTYPKRKARHPFCWECSRRLWAGGRAFTTIVGEDGHEHDVHNDCVLNREVIFENKHAAKTN